MAVRRFAALLLTLLTLHLNLLGTDSACAKHGSHGLSVGGERMQMASGMSSAMTHTGHLSATKDNAQHEPCEIPAQSNCCRALVSCSIVFSSNDAINAESMRLHDLIAGSVSRVPRSEIVAPDPPPPKA